MWQGSSVLMGAEHVAEFTATIARRGLSQVVAGGPGGGGGERE